MNFDTFAVAAIASELRQTVLEGRVQRVTQTHSLLFGLELFVHPTRYYLMLSIEPQNPYLYLTTQKARRGTGNETPLMLVLRKYMRGARLRSITQPPHERVLLFHFDNYIGQTTLVVELFGPRSNVALLDADGTILGVARLSKNVQEKQARQERIYLPGHLYEPPPPQSKLDPATLTEPALRRELAESSPDFPLARLLPQIVAGLSPQLARELIYRATGETTTTIEQLTDVAPLLAACDEMFAYWKNDTWQPTLALDEDETPITLAPYPLTHLPHGEPIPTFSEAVIRFLAESAMAYAAAKAPLFEAIKEARRRLERRQTRLEEDAAERANPESFKEKGEAILANAYQIKARQTKLTVPWLEPPLEIALDPSLSASENAQSYFQRYRKALRAQDEIPLQLEKIQLEVQYLDQLEQDVEMAEDRTEIDTVADELAEAGYYKPTKLKKRRKQSVKRYLRLTAPQGATVWVGKNALQNAHLTFHRASADDLWLHARGLPGAHVVIPTAEGLPAEEDVLWAAGVAAYYSRARHDTAVDVIVTMKKYVRAIKGAAPGLVTCRNESTLHVAPILPEIEE